MSASFGPFRELHESQNPRSVLTPASEQRDPTAFLAQGFLVAVAFAAYANTLDVPFFFDDIVHIVDDPSIRQIWPPWDLLSDPFRPIAKLTLAFNYAIGGLNPAGYHALNAVIHAVAGLALFGIVRLTLIAAPMSPRTAVSPRAFAFWVALIWLVHPLQTQAVTYTIQRGESLAAMWVLLTLYSAVRSASSGRAAIWGAVAVSCCALGMGTKEIAVSAPIVVLLHDRTFFAGSFRRALLARWPLHLGLAACWSIVVALLVAGFGAPGGREHFLGRELESPLAYAATQPEIVLHYLRLAVWPHPLVFDYAWAPATGLLRILPAVATIATLLGVCAWGVWRSRWWGSVAASFFVVLAPTSSIVPLADLANEHRMYLPLASVVTLAVAFAVQRLARQRRWLCVGLGAGVAILLFTATVQRNSEYLDTAALWRGVTERRPENFRAHLNLASTLSRAGDYEAALPYDRRAAELRPEDPTAHFNWANDLTRLGQHAEAAAHYRAAIRAVPVNAAYHDGLGVALRRDGNIAEAIAAHEKALQLAPRNPRAHLHLGNAFAARDAPEAARASYRRALILDPGYTAAHRTMGLFLQSLGEYDAAETHFRRAIDLEPASAKAYAQLGNLRVAAGRSDRAVEPYRQAIALGPDTAGSYNRLAWIFSTHSSASVRRPKEAVSLARRAAALSDDHPSALDTLATAQAATGDFEGARATARRALQAAKDEPLRRAITQRLALFETGIPYVETSSTRDRR